MDRHHPSDIASRPLVLIVDDHDDTRELYIVGLAAFGFKAIEASDGEQALRQARESHPDMRLCGIEQTMCKLVLDGLRKRQAFYARSPTGRTFG